MRAQNCILVSCTGAWCHVSRCTQHLSPGSHTLECRALSQVRLMPCLSSVGARVCHSTRFSLRRESKTVPG